MPFSKAAANFHLIRGGWDDPNCARPTRGVCDRALREHRDRPSLPFTFFSTQLDSLACHEQVRLIDRVDFLHRHIELKSQFDQVPLWVMHLPPWNQHSAIAFP